MHTSFLDWQFDLLRARGLSAPDGRPLHAYRLTQDEFVALQSLLRDNLARYLQTSDGGTLGLVAERIEGFCEIFVLYAAEWWRARYDGTGFAWGPILMALNVGDDAWTQVQRSTCVQRGLRKWGLDLHQCIGLRYLGSIALQGGLPMALLAQARGPLGRLLFSVLQEAANVSATPNDIRNWIRSLEHLLPLTYRQPEIHLLLGDVIHTVLSLKQEAGLTGSETAVAELDQRIPSWRERFPLPVGDKEARGLIEQLIRDAVVVQVKRPSRLFLVERRLERDDEGEWLLHSTLHLPDGIEEADLKSFFSIDDNTTLPRMLRLILTAATGKHTTSLRRMAGRDTYRIERQPWSFSGTEAAAEHLLHLASQDGRMWSASIPHGEELETELPWIFDVNLRWLRQGGGAVAASEVLVALAPGWHSREVLSSAGVMTATERQIYRVQGTVHFEHSDRTCRIRTGHADAHAENYAWLGTRLWALEDSSGMVYVGQPRLHRVDATGQMQPMTGQPAWCPLGGRQPQRVNPLGPVEWWFPAKGDVKHHTRMVILPPQARWSLACDQANAGQIRLMGWKAIGASVNQSHVTAQVQRNGDELIIHLQGQAQIRTPAWITVDVYWPHTPRPAHLRFPFPARGARFFGPDDHELPDNALLAASRLHGVRLLCLGGVPDAMPRMTLNLHVGNLEETLPIQPPAGFAHAEIRLLDHASRIAQLLATNDDPDARLIATVRIAETNDKSLTIMRHMGKLHRDGPNIRLGLPHIPQEFPSVRMAMTLRLDAPGEEPATLDPVGDPSSLTWAFVPERREPGAWLIYPEPDSPLPFRPTLWPVAGKRQAEGELVKAIGLDNPRQRDKALDTVIGQMASDYQRPDWTDIERLAGSLGYLPLATLDLWRRLTHSGSAMAALALRFTDISFAFIDRFADELPFAWETVPFSAWRMAIHNLRCQCKASFGSAADTVFTAHLQRRNDDLMASHPALQFQLAIAHALADGINTQEMKMFRQLGDVGITERLFVGDGSLLQGLLRRQVNATWPDFFNHPVSASRQHPTYRKLLCRDNHEWREGVINLPLLLAAQVATGDSGWWREDAERIHALRRLRDFDPDWFDDAFNWTIARCLVLGLLEER